MNQLVTERQQQGASPPRITLTQGLLKAMMKHTTRKPCVCGFAMPRYPGRYPTKCPHCGAPREQK